MAHFWDHVLVQYLGKDSVSISSRGCSVVLLIDAQELTVYPISCGTLVNFAAFRSRYDKENTTFNGDWVQDVSREEFFADFTGWEPEVHSLIQVCAYPVLLMWSLRHSIGLFQAVQKVNRWAIHTTSPLPSFVSGRVALLGDAVRHNHPQLQTIFLTFPLSLYDRLTP